MKHFLIYLQFLLSVGLTAQGQIVIDRFQNWNVINGLKSSTITSCVFDTNGVLYASNINSIQKFDGTYFLDFNPNNVTFGTHNSVYISRENHLYVFAKNNLYRYKNLTSLQIKAETINLKHKAENKTEVINENEDELWLYNAYLKEIIIIDKAKLSIILTHKLDFDISIGGYFSNVQNAKNEVVIFRDNQRITLTKNQGRLSINHSTVFDFNIDAFLRLDNDLYLAIAEGKLVELDPKNQSSINVGDLGSSKRAFRSTMSKINNSEYLITYDNTVYIYNEADKQLKIIVKNKKGESFFENGPIVKSYVDKYQNIYLVSLAEGIVKFSKPWNIIHSIKNEKSKSDFITVLYYDNEEEVLLVGSYRSGITVYDKNHKNIFEIRKGQTPVTIWKNKIGEYYYLTFENNSIYYIRNMNGKYQHGTVYNSTVQGSFYQSILSEDSKMVTFIQKSNLFGIPKNSKIKAPEFYQSIPQHTNKNYITGIKDAKIILGGIDEVTILDTTYRFIKKIKFDDKAYIRKLLRKNKNEIYMASDKGLELYTNNMVLLKTIYKGPVFSIVSSGLGNIWCGTNNGIICVANENVLYFNKSDGLSCNEYNGNCALSVGTDLIFGGIGGIDFFDESKLLNLNGVIDCSLSEIEVNNEKNINEYYSKGTITLPYDKSYLNFKLSPLGAGDINAYILQYRMVGLSNQWINGLQNRNISYQLSPGKYEFQYAARKYFSTNTDSYKSIFIEIKPPFYKTWSFIILLLSTILGILFYIFFLVNRIKYEKQKTEWQIRENLLNQRSEFSKELHDLIGSQIGIVTRNIDYILDEAHTLSEEKVQEMLTQTMGLSKQIAKDVRDTIWVSTKETITFNDFVLRLRDHTYYYKYLKIEIIIENNVDHPNSILQPIEGLNLLRIVQEAIQNAEKHSKSTNLKIVLWSDPNLGIEIIDTGLGFDTNSTLNVGYGIDNMIARAKKIDYELSLKSSESGTNLKLYKK